MAEITKLTANGKLAEDWQTINNNFENLNTGKAEASTTYTKTEVDSAVSTKVSKSGDTMSGNIIFSGSTPEIKKSANGGYLILRGGTTYNDSANVLLYGNNESNGDNAGRVILRAGNGSTSITVDKNGTSAPTPATTDNSTKIATTAYVRNSSVSKAGDTMSGGISYSTNTPMKRNVNDSTLLVFGGTAYDKGAYLELRGGENSTEAGKAYLWGRNGSQGACLSVSPDGTTSAPTPATTDNSTKIATTAFVNNACLTLSKSTLTLNSTYIASQTENKCYVVGKMAILSININVNSACLSAPANTVLVSGYPKAKEVYAGVIVGMNGHIRVKILTNGELIIDNIQLNGACWLNGSMVYPIA